MEKKKKVSLKTDLKSFFRQYLEILKPLHSITSRECDVLSRLLYYEFIYRDYPEKIKSKAIFDYDTKLEIREELGMSKYQLLNIFKSLRKKGAIKNDTIDKAYRVYPTEDFAIIYQFDITDGVQMSE